MDRGTNWKVSLVDEDALLFELAPDGTVTMRAVPLTEWEARLAENERREPRRPVGELVRQIVNTEAGSGVVSAGTPTSIGAARKV